VTIRNNTGLRRTIIGVVTDTGAVDMFFAQALSESIKLAITQQVLLVPVFLRSLGNATMCFNRLITLAWREGADDLVFVSPNCYWQPTALLEAVFSTKDVLALPVSSSGGFRVHLGELPRLQTDEKTGEIKVLSSSIEFLRISKTAITKLCETHPTIDFEGEELKLVLQHGDVYGAFATDSEVLTYRLKEAGFEVWLNPQHTVNTVFPQPVEASFEKTLKDLKGEAV
jgi:hypothetical protein